MTPVIYLRAWEDGTWDEFQVDIPVEDADTSDAANDYAYLELAGQARYRRVVYWVAIDLRPELVS